MKLSIVICNYNYGRFLDGAIASALAQSYENTEVIVVDDGSTDDSQQVIERRAATSSIKCILLDSNRGQIEAYNRGFEAASGDVILFLDSDDLLDPDLSTRVMNAFSDPTVTKVHFRMRLVDSHGRRLGSVIPRSLAEGALAARLLQRGMLYESSPGSGNAYRRSALLRLMPLPASSTDRNGADFFALLGVSLLGTVKSLGEAPLASYRVHAAGSRERTQFGNLRLQEPEKSRARYRRLRAWVPERLGPQYELPTKFVDFSIDKQVFANLVFDNSYPEGLRKGGKFLVSQLVRAIWWRPSSVQERLGLTGWALAVLTLPRSISQPIARFVCNPASRGLAPSLRPQLNQRRTARAAGDSRPSVSL